MSKRIITLGTWEGKQIEWIVLKEESFGVLVISKTALFSCKFNSNSNDGNKWKNSELRKFVNNEFFRKAFTDEEKKQIVNVYLPEPNKTKDDVFVLSAEEAGALMTRQERAIGNMQWTRSPNGSITSYAWRILPNGEISDGNYFSGFSPRYGYINESFWVRPAMYIKER